jgi:hypothetical protein
VASSSCKWTFVAAHECIDAKGRGKRYDARTEDGEPGLLGQFIKLFMSFFHFRALQFLIAVNEAVEFFDDLRLCILEPFDGEYGSKRAADEQGANARNRRRPAKLGCF